VENTTIMGCNAKKTNKQQSLPTAMSQTKADKKYRALLLMSQIELTSDTILGSKFVKHYTQN
jgi:hypothetical protein